MIYCFFSIIFIDICYVSCIYELYHEDNKIIIINCIPDIKLPMVPLGTNNADSMPNVSATVDCSSEIEMSSLDKIKYMSLGTQRND